MADPFTRIGEWRLATDAGGWPRAVLGGTWDRPYLAVAADAETLHVAAIEVPIAVVRAVIERSAPVTALGEIERLVEDLIGEGCKALAPSEPKVRAARTALLAAIARALSDRDARIADLERHAAFFRSLANVRAIAPPPGKARP